MLSSTEAKKVVGIPMVATPARGAEGAFGILGRTLASFSPWRSTTTTIENDNTVEQNDREGEGTIVEKDTSGNGKEREQQIQR